MAVINTILVGILRKMSRSQKLAVLTLLFGVIGFSLGDSSKSCDLVKRDFDRISVNGLKISEKPETGKYLFNDNLAFVY